TTSLSSGVPLNNYGTIDLESGTLVLNDALNNNGQTTLASGATLQPVVGGTSSAVINAAAGSVVNWAGGTFALNPGAQLDGGGDYRVNAALSLNANVSVQNLELYSLLEGRGSLTVSNILNWNNGIMSGSGQTIIAPGGTLNLAGANSVTLTGWQLQNEGTVFWTGTAPLVLTTGAIITNSPGALFNVQNTGTVGYGGGAPCRFDNAGVYSKSIGAGTNTISANIMFNNNGTLGVQAGAVICNGLLTNNGQVTLAPGTMLQAGGGGSASGLFSASAATLLDWSAGAYTLNPGAQLNGTGAFAIGAPATVTLNTNFGIQNFNLGGTLAGNGSITISNAMTWIGGAMNGTGRTTIAAGASLNISNSASLSLASRTLENDGTSLWTGPGLIALSSGAIITNHAGALFNLQNAITILYGGGGGTRFDNDGILLKTASLGTTAFSTGVPLVNYGTLDIEMGIISANGGYVSGNSALLNCAIGGPAAGTNYGQLQIPGASVALAGALSISLTNGFYPATNESFTLLTAGAISQPFTSFSYPSNRVTLVLSNSPNAVVARVVGVAPPPPQPFLLSPTVLGTNVQLAWTAVSNSVYRIEYIPQLQSSIWSALPGDVTAVSSNASKLDVLTDSNRFYRVKVMP
ncbi:MAG: hypothetical protein ABSH48_26365, partial [Verrucomicrobiota bacterium]